MTEVDAINDISLRIMTLAREESSAQRAKSDRLVELAASMEMLSDDLQLCWGGPLNGQAGRRALFKQLLTAIGFDAIVETGTFRGITTQWFAENFAGPIASCDHERLYFLQAQQRLKAFANVQLHLQDSREFLREHLAALAPGSAVLVYLDAHWHGELPLCEELHLITEHKKLRTVIAVDDFQVPGDAGYAYDDYGQDQKICLELLAFLQDDGFRFYFPKLPSSQESGAVRGVCVLSKAMTDALDRCDLMCGGDWNHWRAIEMNEKQRMGVQPITTGNGSDERSAESTALIGTMIDHLHRQMKDSLASEMNDAIRALGRELGTHITEEARLLTMSMQADLAQRLAPLPEVLSSLTVDSFPPLETLLTKVEGGQTRLQEDMERSAGEPRRSNETLAMGRALVEEKARVLDLQRQNHLLKDQVQLSQELRDNLLALLSDSQFCHAIQCVVNEVTQAHPISKGLVNSRANKAISHMAPRSRVDILQLAAHMQALALAAAQLSKFDERLRALLD